MSNPWADVKQGSLARRYLYTRAVDEVFARLADSQQNGQLELSWYLADRLGSVRQQVQTDGTILNEINYDSFGNVVTETNPAEGDRFKYTGREYDDLTGLYYYRARWYDARTGKFLSEDPLGFAAGDYNLGRYVGNDPVNSVDPRGLWTFSLGPEIDLFAVPFFPLPMGAGVSVSVHAHIGFSWRDGFTFGASVDGASKVGVAVPYPPYQGSVELDAIITDAPNVGTLLGNPMIFRGVSTPCGDIDAVETPNGAYEGVKIGIGPGNEANFHIGRGDSIGLHTGP